MDGQRNKREISRLRWQCRRGVKELDLLLEAYLNERFAQASAQEQLAFADLLALPDPVLLGYILGREQPPNEEQGRVIARLRRTAGN